MDGFLDEVIGLLTKNPTPDEIVVERAKSLRWVEHDDIYAEPLAACSQPLNTCPVAENRAAPGRYGPPTARFNCPG
ncbi:hypothetical protein ACFQS1_40240 [Paractinoplanes rhizophilus]|jgi:hypothetical protein|uniref:Uncharacterized protein n=1 Tax=Paractinoplanes rhizophilus TaxID=1416877 RepID=A0ABW2I5U5_9ACTN|nr:hypothetical protein [Actinoplanes sp.]